MFKITKPCSDCPFLKENGVRLTQRRIEEIAGLMLEQGGGAPFWCHKTTTIINDKECDETQSLGDEAFEKIQHCAGALIFAEKNGSATQTMQVGLRLGAYRPEDVLADATVVANVCNTLQEMLEVNGCGGSKTGP